MTGMYRRLRAALVTASAVLVAGCLLAGSAGALTYRDVPKTHWAYSIITWVTSQGRPGAHLLDDFGGGIFKPDQALTRGQLARAVVIASGHQDDAVPRPAFIPDVPPSASAYDYIQIALSLKLMTTVGGDFRPNDPAPSWLVDRTVVRMLMLLHPDPAWTMLDRMNPAHWRPNPGWATGAPSYTAYEIAARSLGLRYNHPSGADALETFPTEPMSRAETTYVFSKALRSVTSWDISSLAMYENVTFPTLSARQKQVVTFALKYIGYPYVWGGEWPTPNSPYGHQAHGGFDCSGFDWWVLKLHFGYPIPSSQRGAHDMAGAAKPRIPYKLLRGGDMIFFGPNGTHSTVASIYHAAIYLGNGWFIQSTGSSDGVSIESLANESWWMHDFAWGRHVLTPAELVVK